MNIFKQSMSVLFLVELANTQAWSQSLRSLHYHHACT